MPGASVLASPAPLYASAVFTFLSYPSVTLTECEDVAGCRTTANEISSAGFPPIFGSLIFDQASGNQATGTSTFASSAGAGPCTGEVSTRTVTLAEDGSITIETRTVIVENVPYDAEDGCDLEAAEAMAEGQPCSALEIIEADFVEAL